MFSLIGSCYEIILLQCYCNESARGRAYMMLAAQQPVACWAWVGDGEGGMKDGEQEDGRRFHRLFESELQSVLFEG